MFSQGRIDCQHAIGMSENANGAVLCGKYLEFYKQEKLKLLPEFLKKSDELQADSKTYRLKCCNHKINLCDTHALKEEKALH